ncbi:MAG: ATP-binding protein [Armatimonadota bacterium]|nr:ATP-binding protein [Armatimonadota bacterium]MDR7443552.1 ATP-binding protein [Armatimonadota bacterium]MDR7570952.1 ATP-binding protein [Armatimonadota bacterium]MDR7615050.1 ATP-binding protein [Armatimonadota bacterium]
MTDRELLKYRLEIWRCLRTLPDGQTVRHRIGDVLAAAVSADRVMVGRWRQVRSPVREHRIRVDSPGGRPEDLWVERDLPLSRAERRMLRTLWRDVEEVLAVSTRAEQAVESERHRQAVWLHQGPAQALVRALLALRLYRQEAGRDPTAARKLLTQAVDLVQQALRAVRETIRVLKCRERAFPGMEQAIQEAWIRLQAFTEARLSVDVECPEELPRQVEEGLTAVACEAVANAARHAGASRIGVRLRRVRDAVTLEVLDDGKGLGTGSGPRQSRRSFGLMLMQEQVARLGGRLRIRSGPEGTRIRVVVPLGVRDPRGARSSEAVRARRGHAHSRPAR